MDQTYVMCILYIILVIVGYIYLPRTNGPEILGFWAKLLSGKIYSYGRYITVSLFRKKNINIPTDTTADKNGNKKLNVTFKLKKKKYTFICLCIYG